MLAAMASARPDLARRRATGPARWAAPARAAEEAIVLALFDLANHLQRRGEQLAATAGLTTQQWLVLLQIGGDPNFPSAPTAGGTILASDIARARGVTRATVSAVVTALERRGLIVAASDARDARRRRLALTPAGAELLAALQPARGAANRRLLGGLAARDRARFLGYLDHCLATLWDAYEGEQLAAARARLARPRRRPA